MPGRRVRLEEIGIAASSIRKSTAPAAAAENTEGFQRLLLDLGLAFGRQAAGAAVLRVIAVVLRFVVVELRCRFDLDDRQGTEGSRPAR